jgi:hypothetical protein
VDHLAEGGSTGGRFAAGLQPAWPKLKVQQRRAVIPSRRNPMAAGRGFAGRGRALSPDIGSILLAKWPRGEAERIDLGSVRFRRNL